jgi:hypothetical protein
MMSEHAWTLENLAAYLADGLESAERERLEQHAAECESCAAALAEARRVDDSLTDLFAATRPGPILEDRVIQSLRTQGQASGRWLPGWLAGAAAALLLIGLTGSVASYLLFPGGLASPNSPQSENMLKQLGAAINSYKGEIPKAVGQMAEELREKALVQLDPSWDAKNLNWDSNQLGFYPPSAGFTVKGTSKIHSRGGELTVSPTDGTSNTTGIAEKPQPKGPQVLMGDGRVPPGGGVPGGQPASSYNYWRDLPHGEPAQSVNFYTNLNQPSAPPTPTGPAATYGTQPGYFAPSQLAQKGADNKEDKKNQADPKQPADEMERLSKLGGQGKGEGQGQGQGKGEEKGKERLDEKRPEKAPQEAGPRKIVIRTGEVEYEVQSFDAAVATIARLVKSIKGGFIATVNSDKLANGKVRGSVVVRVPPESLDQLILDLRTNLGKSGELKNQRIGSQDITKQYTDLESRLRAARAMEERLLQIIKSGKGEIKDLLAVEKELGTWRTRIEEFEGELRYYANQVALSTLSIVLYESQIQAPFGIVECERVRMALEADDVDLALREAQKAVREAKGRITKSELKQHSAGQYSATLHFEVSPDASGPVRDRLKQLGTVARLEVDRQEETEGGTGKPSDGKTRRIDSRFQVSIYNLTNVAPRETVFVYLACVDVEAVYKTLLARVDKAAGRVISSNLNSAKSEQTQGDIQFEVKTATADVMLEDIKGAGEVMRLQVTENPNAADTTRKKRGFRVQLFALAAVAPRETDEIQVASPDVAAGYRALQEAVAKAKGRMLNAQLNEQDRRKVTATLDFEFRRADEAVVRAALATAGDMYTRKVTRAANTDNVIDSKVRWQVTLINQANIPPRETYLFGIEVSDVDQTAAMLSALVGERQGRTIQANISRERNGRVTGKLVYDVPLAKVHELIDRLKSFGIVRVQQSAEHPEVPESALAVARLDVTLSTENLLVPSDEGFGPTLRRGLSVSFRALSWSLMVLVLGLCVLLPWALVIWAIVKLFLRLRRKAGPAIPAA